MSEPVLYVGGKTGRGSPRLLNSAAPLSFKATWSGPSSGITPSLVHISDRPDVLGEPLGVEIERFDVEFDTIARSFGTFLRELQGKYVDTWALIGGSPLRAETELGVEREIVVRMSPASSRDVKVRAKYMGRAKPTVVFDPVSGD